MASLPARSIRTEMSLDEEFHRTYTSYFQVITNKADSGLVAINAPGIPAYGSYYTWGVDYDLWAVVRSATVRPTQLDIALPGGGQGVLWEVVVSYSSRPRDHSSGDARENPLDQRPIISGSFVKTSLPTHRDKDGALLVNAAKEAFDPPLSIDASFDSVNIQYNTATISLPQRASAIDKVNSAEMWGLGTRQIKLLRWDYTIEYLGNFAYIKNTFEFLINRTEHPESPCVGPSEAVGWYNTLPNTGTRYYPGGWASDKKYRLPMSETDNPTTKPVQLTCGGDLLTTGETWNVFAVEKEYNFLTIPSMPNPLSGPFV